MAVVTAAVVGIAATAASTTMSFRNAAKQKKAAEEADAEAKKAMQEAKSKAEVDYFASLNVPLDAYEAEFENQLAGQQQAIEALQEGDARALAAGVGRVGAQQTAAGEQTRIAMGEEISDLNMMKAESKDAINQQLIEMDVAQAREQNQRRADAEFARSQSIQEGVAGVGALVGQVGDAAPLFSQSGATRRGAKLAKQSQVGKGDMNDAQYQNKLSELGLTREEYRRAKGMNDAQLTEFYKSKGFNFPKKNI
ncbi:MAG: hypothetical protein Unbinned6224contig1000_26 [Prokaryotic dsDNA virus sp.]|nr:MAG: hypothetical protein Unbinned6224contig1000_26 [Prokaryotic dsDNA virus sp.]|tara:strand:- start:19312 stop:20067 length:756 start_codon:yes stop_codon:yes gene_type:complete